MSIYIQSLTFLKNICQGAVAMHLHGCVRHAGEVTQTGHISRERES